MIGNNRDFYPVTFVVIEPYCHNFYSFIYKVSYI